MYGERRDDCLLGQSLRVQGGRESSPPPSTTKIVLYCSIIHV